MIPVDQTIVRADNGKGVPGDCLRAGVASLFELDIIQVPHFLLFDERWFFMLRAFIEWLDYEMYYEIFANSDGKFSYKHLINNCILAKVKSRIYKTGAHCVLINSRGRVIHDPNPNKKFQNVNVIKTGEIIGWYCLRKKG